MSLPNQNKENHYLCSILSKSYITMDVKSIIKEKGWTIEGVANKMGITRITLSQNLSRNPTVNTLQRVADVIGCKVGDFFRDEIEIQEPVGVCPHCGKPIAIRTELIAKG